MERFVSAIRNSIQSENWYAALFLALAMPDICSKLEQPESGNSGPRYRAWFETYLSPVNTRDIMGQTVVFMSAGDCWALRCSLLHEGSDDIGEQRARETVSRFRFTTLGSHRIKINDVLERVYEGSSLLNINRIFAKYTHDSVTSGKPSKSRTSRLQRVNHAKERSTIQRLGKT
jgi:hypothetical protein